MLDWIDSQSNPVEIYDFKILKAIKGTHENLNLYTANCQTNGTIGTQSNPIYSFLEKNNPIHSNIKIPKKKKIYKNNKWGLNPIPLFG